MINTAKFSGICFSLVFLTACGGSGDSASINESSVSNPAGVVFDEPNNNTGLSTIANEAPDVVVDNQTNSTSSIPTDTADSGNSSSDIQIVNSDELAGEQAGEQANEQIIIPVNNENAAALDTDATVADTLTTDTSGSSFCQPVSTSVTFEPYCHVSSDCNVQDGRNVPVPADGFGWDGTQICDLSASFGIDVIEVLVPFVRENADIDGYPEPSWRNAAIAGTVNRVVSRNDIDNLLLSPVPGYLDGAGYSTWSAMHDGTNLYLHVRISSEAGNAPFFDSPGRPWFDDSIEIFIDGNNSKGSEYDGIDDFQAILLAHSSADWQPVISPSSASDLGIFYRTGANGATLSYEIAINLESAGIIPGQPFGFDVQVNEDDNGGDRDAKWGWFEQSGFDRSFLRPNVFGTLVLTECDDPVTCGSHQILSR